ncbi:MAG: nucleoside 2-deoxyribosyltransferase [Neisseria sp.]|uniref:nucleoside 2-deoxyribosyltransferase n=1 Tax=Neisseria sp. TaxID=192066 RepID=UPI0026DDB671|nr:nucleoside 2-deoxyribosyltransferase [Neisseria sp.]MDO4640373.1 nucleoside 2-deoxyribosyltransferase [Neisseria sp.]
MMKIWKIYCAGGDVFLPESKRSPIFAQMEKLADELSDRHCCFQLLLPLDNEIDLSPGFSLEIKRDNALKIRLANERMIQECDAVIANLSPFRGAEPDCGTAYECGFARALGKRVLAYSDNLAEQTVKYDGFDFMQTAPDGRFAYTEIEDFALPFNLMLYDVGMTIFKDFAAALDFYADQCKRADDGHHG